MPSTDTQFKPGNPGKPRGAAPITKKRARRLAREAIIAGEVKAMGGKEADFDGDAHEYLQAVYRGEIQPDQLRMAAAATALRVEKPALAAAAVKVEDVTFAAELDAACRRVGLTIDAERDINPLMRHENPQFSPQRPKRGP
jgi:hypothetical protein